MKQRYIIAALMLLLLPSVSFGQAIRGSYFFETSLQRNKMNAAFVPQNNYVSIPVLGNLGVESYSNLGLSNFIFPKLNVSGGSTVYSFLNKNITMDEFKRKLPSEPFIGEDINFSVLDLGVKIGKAGYLTAGVSFVEQARLGISHDLLGLPKQGMGTYDVSGTSINAAAYLQLAVGYSHDLSNLVEGLHVGGKIKVLNGLAAMDFSLNNGSQVVLSEDKILANLNASGNLSGSVSYDETNEEIIVNFINNSIGLAVDFGGEYRLKLDDAPVIDGLNFSLAVNNLGALNFSGGQKLASNGNFTYTPDSDLGSDDFNSLDDAIDGLDDLTQFNTSKIDSYKYALTPSIYAGVEAPFLNEKMSVGLLYYNVRGFSSLMASYNLSPARWFNLGVNYTFVGPAKELGTYIEIVPKGGIEFFLGAEVGSLKLTPQFIPVNNFSAHARFGLNIVFGGNKF